MHLQDIPQGATILAPSYLHTWIRKTLLQNKQGIADIALYSFSTYMQKESKQHYASLFTYYEKMKKLTPSLTYHTKNTLSLSFLAELKDAVSKIKAYDIHPDSLPQTSAFQKEQKQILESLLDLPLLEDTILKQVKNTVSFQGVYILDAYCDVFTQKMYTIMENKGAVRLSFPIKTPKKKFYHALNKRQEVESAAQYIITQGIDADNTCIQVLQPEYIPYIKSVFSRYQIPFYLVKEKEITRLQAKYIAFLQFYLTNDVESSVQLLLQNVFSHSTSQSQACISYLRLHKRTLLDNMPLCYPEKTQFVDKREKEALLALQEESLPLIEEVRPFLQALVNKEGMDVLYAIDAYLCEHHAFTNEAERSALLSIRSLYEEAKTILHTKVDMAFFLEVIKTQKTASKKSIQGCAVSTLDMPMPERNTQIVLGASQDAFPAFAPLSGMFEESYFAALSYPSKEERYVWHEKQITNNLLCCEELVVFYSLSTFDGKAQEASLEMETLMETQAIAYPIIEHHTPYERKHTITADDAKAIFTKDHTLYGSVSSLERYAACPYAYFLRYGLGLQEPLSLSFQSAKAGLLSHAILERLTKTYGKDYAKATVEEVYALLHQGVEEMIQLYPAQENYLLQMENRLLAVFMKNLAVLNEQEAHSSLVPYACEYRFKHTYPIDDTYSLTLHGIIDRIDANKDFFMITDYKSSPHQLKEELVFSAQQLQLITYATVMEEQLGKRLLGSFYYSLQNPNTNMYYAKLKKRPLGYSYLDAEEANTLFLKEKKRNGWIYEEHIEVFDDDGEHTKGVRNSKASGISARTIYDSQVLRFYNEDMLKQLATSILSGNIACENSADACTYCPYQSICSNKNTSYTKSERVEVQAELYKKGGRKDA